LIHYKKSIQKRYWVSLLVFLIPVVIFGIFIYTYNINSSKNYISQTRISSFQQATNQVGYIFEQLKTMSLDVSANQDRFIDANGSGTVDESAIFTKLLSMEENAAINVEALFYIRGEEYIYSSSQKYLYGNFEQQYNTYDISRSLLFTKLNQSLAPTIYRFYFRDQSIGGDGLIVFIYPLSHAESYPSAYIVFLIQENSLKEKFSEYLGDSKWDLYVYNNRLNIVLSTQNNENSTEFTEILKTKGIGQISLPKSNKIAMRQIINGSELTVVTVMSEKDFYQQLLPSQRILFMLIVLLVLCCLVLAFLGVKRTYTPIKNLISDIAEPNTFNDQHVNEIDLIKNSFKQSRERNQSLMQQLANQNAIVANQFVFRLINGKFKNMEEFHYNANCIGFVPDKQYWIAMHLNIFNQSSWRQTIDQVLELSKNFDIAETTCLFTEQIQQPGICYVFHFNCETSDLSDFCNGVAEQFRQFLFSNNIQDFTISVGSPCSDPFMVKQSSFEAGAAVQIAEPTTGQIYFYRQTENIETGNYMLPAMEKSLLIEGIRHGDNDTAYAALGNIIHCIERACHSLLLSRLLCSELLNILINLAKDNHILLEQNDLKDLVIFNTITEFHESALTLVTTLCSQIQAQIDLNSSLQKKDVLTFISSNYTREDFSLDFVADSMSLTKSKISTILKEDVGCGFPQYISILRMNEVKQQLIKSTKPIQDIVKDVGYLDVPNFMRKFKMIEGITPGQFRTLHGKQ